MSRSWFLLCFLLLAFISFTASAQEREGTDLRKRYEGEKNGPRGECSTEWTTLNGGLHYRAVRCLGSSDLDLHLVRIDPDRWTLDTALVDAGSARSVARSRKAPFAINANFFDTAARPYGFVVSFRPRLRGSIRRTSTTNCEDS